MFGSKKKGAQRIVDVARGSRERRTSGSRWTVSRNLADSANPATPNKAKVPAVLTVVEDRVKDKTTATGYGTQRQPVLSSVLPPSLRPQRRLGRGYGELSVLYAMNKEKTFSWSAPTEKVGRTRPSTPVDSVLLGFGYLQQWRHAAASHDPLAM